MGFGLAYRGDRRGVRKRANRGKERSNKDVDASSHRIVPNCEELRFGLLPCSLVSPRDKPVFSKLSRPRCWDRWVAHAILDHNAIQKDSKARAELDRHPRFIFHFAPKE